MPFYYATDIFNKKEKHDSLGLVDMMFLYFCFYVDLLALFACFRTNDSSSILLE
jgi:hypothetical protein